MLFLPLRADFALPGIPVLTVLVCLICAGVFYKQINDTSEFNAAAERFCDLERSRLETIVYARIAEANHYGHCAEMMFRIDNASDSAAEIDAIVSGLRPLVGFNREDSREYVSLMLEEELRLYQGVVPAYPLDGLGYHSESWNPWTMLTSAFAHGDWGHIIFNLIFFVAFAATVEALMGPIAFAAAIVAIALFTGVFTSIGAYASGVHNYNVGLSGVVMGMMGLYSYLLPRGRIRCFYWFIVVIGTVAIPAWALTLWFVGGDIYRLFAYDDHGLINVMAHVTGGIAGYLIGVLFLRKARERARDLQFELDFHADRSAA